MATVLLLLLPLKSALYLGILMRLGLRTRTSVLATLSLGNYSEFGLIVVALSATSGWLSDDWLVVISLALALSFVATAPLNIASEWIYTRLRKPLGRFEARQPLAEDRPIELDGVDALVLGMGRIGSGAYDTLSRSHGFHVRGIDNSSRKVADHSDAGRSVIEGDAADSDFWDKLVISDQVKLILLAMSQHAGNVYALQQLKHRKFKGRIAAIVQYQQEVDALRALGADAVFNIYDEAGSAFADDAVTSLMGVTPPATH